MKIVRSDPEAETLLAAEASPELCALEAPYELIGVGWLVPTIGTIEVVVNAIGVANGNCLHSGQTVLVTGKLDHEVVGPLITLSLVLAFGGGSVVEVEAAVVVWSSGL